MAKKNDKSRQVGKNTICRLQYELIDKESGKVEQTETIETPVFFLTAHDPKGKNGYFVRGLVNCGKETGLNFLQALTKQVANLAATLLAEDVAKAIASDMVKQEIARKSDPFPEFTGGGDDNT